MNGRTLVAALHRILLAALLLLALAAPATAARGPLVLAAASLQEAMLEAADSWAAQGHARPVVSFAASSALARQVEAGAPADLFVSADNDWMDYLQGKGLLRRGSRAVLARNRLALVARRGPAGAETGEIRIGPGLPLARLLGRGRLAMADPEAVPAGRYGRAALESLGIWPTLAGRIAGAENVRAALALVERGAAPFGIVYATDARASKLVRVVGLFPETGHPPIVYPLAILSAARNADAEAFRRFLLSPAGQRILAAHGFAAP